MKPHLVANEGFGVIHRELHAVERGLHLFQIIWRGPSRGERGSGRLEDFTQLVKFEIFDLFKE